MEEKMEVSEAEDQVGEEEIELQIAGIQK